jgi:hypothetical protein
MKNKQKKEICLTPDEWVEETKKFLIEQNNKLGRPKAIYNNDCKYIGMAVIVAESVKKQSEFSYVFSVGTKFELTKSNDIVRYESTILLINAYSIASNNLAVCGVGGHFAISITEFIDGLDSGRFKILK